MIGLAYGELSSTFPRAGGDIVYTFEGLGSRWAFFSGAAVGFAFLTLIIVETIMLPVILEALGFPILKLGELYTIAGQPVYLSYVLISIFINGCFAWMNHRGMEFSKAFQNITVAVLLFASIFYAITGMTLGSGENLKPYFTSFQGLSLTLLMVPGFMSGFNVVAQAVEESTINRKKIGYIIVGTVWTSVLFYSLIILGTGYAATVAARSGEGVVVLDSLNMLFTTTNLPKIFVAIAALIGMLTSWNAAYIAGSRLIFGLGRAKYIPKSFEKLHSKFKTPSAGILLLFGLSSLGALLGTSIQVFTSIVNVSGFMMVISWSFVVIAFLRLRKIAPNLMRPFKVKFGLTIGVLGIISLTFLFLLYTPLNPLGGLNTVELIVALSIVVIVTVLYFIFVHNSKVSNEERRRLLVGGEEHRQDSL